MPQEPRVGVPGDPDPSDDGSGERPRTERRQGEHRASGRESSPLGRALGLTAISTLMPGAGLALSPRWRSAGLVLLAGTALVLAVLGWWVVRNGAVRSALDLAARPGLLRGLSVLLVAGALVWIGAIVLTALVNRPLRMSGGQRGTLVSFTGAMCLLVAAPVAMGLRYIDAHTDAVDSIFVGQPDDDGGSGEGGAGGGGGGAGGGDDGTGPDLEEEDPWARMPRVNVLLLGSDAGDGREGVRTDSMIVASVDTATGDTVLFSIPRNLERVPIPADSPLATVYPDGYDCGAECLMNGIWTEAESLAVARPELFVGDETPGATATREVISEVLGQPIHHTVIVDLQGFEEIVDAMGGLDITVQQRVPIAGDTYLDDQGRPVLIEGTESGWIEVGPQRLTGREALWYARSRVTTDDFSRMRRQRCVVGALVDQVDPMTMIARYPQIVAAAGDNITVDIPQEDLPAWADLVLRIQAGGRIQSLPFTIENTNVVDPDYAQIRREVDRALHPPEPPAPTQTAPSDAQAPGVTGPEATETGPAEPPSVAPTGTPETTEAPPITPPAPSSGPTTPAIPTEDELADIGTVC